LFSLLTNFAAARIIARLESQSHRNHLTWLVIAKDTIAGDQKPTNNKYNDIEFEGYLHHSFWKDISHLVYFMKRDRLL
jgi:hypothetical protein